MMPLYDVKCIDCGATAELFASHSAPLPNCPECLGEMQRMISAPRIMSDIAEYESLMDGTRITSRSHHREHMKRHNVVELGDATPASLEPEKYVKTIDWKQAAAEAAEQITQTRGRKWLTKNLT